MATRASVPELAWIYERLAPVIGVAGVSDEALGQPSAVVVVFSLLGEEPLRKRPFATGHTALLVRNSREVARDTGTTRACTHADVLRSLVHSSYSDSVFIIHGNLFLSGLET